MIGIQSWLEVTYHYYYHYYYYFTYSALIEIIEKRTRTFYREQILH